MIQRILKTAIFLMFILLCNPAMALPAGNQLTVLEKAFGELNAGDFDVDWYADAGKYVVGFNAKKLNQLLAGYGEHVAVDGRTRIKLKQFQVDADGDFRITSHLHVLYTSGGIIRLKARGSGSQTTHIFARIENGKLILNNYRLSHVEIRDAPAMVDDYAKKKFKSALESSSINVVKNIPAIRMPDGVYMLRYEQTVKIPSRRADYLYMVFEDPAAPIIVETSEPDMVEMVRLGMARLDDSDFDQTISGGVYKVGVNLKKLNEIVSSFGTQLVMDGQRNTKPTVKMFDFSIGVHENSLKIDNRTRIIWKGNLKGTINVDVTGNPLSMFQDINGLVEKINTLDETIETFGLNKISELGDKTSFLAYGAGKSVAGDEAGLAASAYADTFTQKYRTRYSQYVKKVGRVNLKKLPYTIPVKFDIPVKVQSTGWTRTDFRLYPKDDMIVAYDFDIGHLDLNGVPGWGDRPIRRDFLQPKIAKKKIVRIVPGIAPPQGNTQLSYVGLERGTGAHADYVYFVYKSQSGRYFIDPATLGPWWERLESGEQLTFRVLADEYAYDKNVDYYLTYTNGRLISDGYYYNALKQQEADADGLYEGKIEIFGRPCRITGTGDIYPLSGGSKPLARFTGGEKDSEVFTGDEGAPISAEGLLAWYPFEGNGNDRGPAGNHGKIQGNASFISHLSGRGLEFRKDWDVNGVEIRNAGFIDKTEKFTMVGWIRRESGNSLLRKENWNVIGFNSRGNLVYTPTTDLTFSATGKKSIDQNEWIFFAYISDSRQRRFYINGEEDATMDAGGSTFRDTYSKPWVLGSGLIGAIDNVAFYSRVLTDNELGRLYRGAAVDRPIADEDIDPAECDEYNNPNAMKLKEDGLAAQFDFSGKLTDDSGLGASVMFNDGTGQAYNGHSDFTADRNSASRRALHFSDSNSAHVSFTLHREVPIRGISFAGWVRTDKRGAMGSYHQIIHLGDQSRNSVDLFVHDINFEKKTATVDVNAFGSNTLQVQVPAGEYFHLVHTVDARGMQRVYVDGKQVTSSKGNTPRAFYEGLGRIGGGSPKYDKSGWGGWRFDGDLDDIRIYARALSATEVAAMYDREQPEALKKKDEKVGVRGAGGASSTDAAGSSAGSNGAASTASSGSSAGGGAVATADPLNGEEIGVATNLGTGQRKTGGKLIWVPVQNLADNDSVSFKVKSGKASYVAIHGRTRYGSWRTLYKGAPKDMKVSQFLGNQRAQFTHIIFSVNGAHERYERLSCELGIYKSSASAASGASAGTPSASAAKKIATATNNGTGRRKGGGSSPRVAIAEFKDIDTVSFRATGGSCQSVTIHGRTAYGSWQTLYTGALKEMKVSDFLKNQRAKFTHLIFSVNGAHENYQPISCTAEILKK